MWNYKINQLSTPTKVISTHPYRHKKEFSYPIEETPLVLYDWGTNQPALFVWCITEQRYTGDLTVLEINCPDNEHKETSRFIIPLDDNAWFNLYCLNVSNKPLICDLFVFHEDEPLNRSNFLNPWFPSSEKLYPCSLTCDRYKTDPQSFFETKYMLKDSKDKTKDWYLKVSNIEGWWETGYQNYTITNNYTENTLLYTPDIINVDTANDFQLEYYKNIKDLKPYKQFKSSDFFSYSQFSSKVRFAWSDIKKHDL